MTKVAIVVAMERELHPLVDGWTKRSFVYAGKTYRCFESGEWIAVAGGIGCGCAESAARAVTETFHPQTLLSAGLAGALVPGIEAGSLVHPDVIVDAASGSEYSSPANAIAPGGVLVTSGEIAGQGAKDRLAQRFHARAVDMEAAGVAKVAQELNTGFVCVKAVSDEYELRLPPLNAFVDRDGNFQVARFGIWAAVRPWRWPAVFRLASNTGRATRVLSGWLRKHLNDNFPGPTVVKLNTGKHLENANANCQQS
jgi:adenosylhomocysteine nucleosidase